MRSLRLAPFVLLAFCFGIEGQTPTGTISGVVSDSSGARVTGAAVQLVNSETGEQRAVKSGDSGNYVFTNVPAGNYALNAEVSGFKREQRTGVRLEVNQNARVDFALQLGQITESVQVSGDVTQVDTRSVQLGGTVDTRRVRELPLNGRNVYDLMVLMPGVFERQHFADRQ